jgi:hypothetical protein
MSDGFSDDAQGLRQLGTPARNNYFYGKLLDVQHFTLEQRYFNHKRWLLNRLVAGSGILCGLGLQAAADGKHVVVRPGAALDPLGREIIVPQSVPVDPRQLTDDAGRPTKPATGPVVTLCLAYHACAAEMVPVLVGDCDTRDGCAPSTIREAFAVIVRDGPAPAYVPQCPIAGLFKPPSGKSSADIADVYAKLNDLVTGTSPEAGPETCVVLGQVTLPAGDSPPTAESIEPAGRRAVFDNTLLLELVLCLWDRVEQCCAAATPTPTPSPTPAPTPTPTPRPS